MAHLITEEDRLLFEKYAELNETAKRSGFVRNYTTEAYANILYLYVKYVSEKQQFSHWCSDCRLQLVKQLYTWYDNYLINHAEVVVNEIAEIVGEPMPIVEQTKKKRGRKPKGGCNGC
jgi:hypothetical protein